MKTTLLIILSLIALNSYSIDAYKFADQIFNKKVIDDKIFSEEQVDASLKILEITNYISSINKQCSKKLLQSASFYNYHGYIWASDKHFKILSATNLVWQSAPADAQLTFINKWQSQSDEYFDKFTTTQQYYDFCTQIFQEISKDTYSLQKLVPEQSQLMTDLYNKQKLNDQIEVKELNKIECIKEEFKNNGYGFASALLKCR